MNKSAAPSGNEVLEKAFAESAGKTVDVVVDQEVAGITPEMFYWWTGEKLLNNYTSWYPEAHLSANIEFPPGGGQPVIKIEEYVGAYYCVFTCQEDVVGKLTMLSADNKPLGGLVHIAEPSPNGTKLHSTFTFPAKTPAAFLESMYGHCRYEMQDLPRFLPQLYSKEAK